jgi:hypothetical protein
MSLICGERPSHESYKDGQSCIDGGTPLTEEAYAAELKKAGTPMRPKTLEEEQMANSGAARYGRYVELQLGIPRLDIR